MRMIKIAFSKIDITPNIPCHLSGFLKERIAAKVHDPLFARSILFFDDISNNYYLLTQLDLIATDHLLKDRLSKLFNNLIHQNILSYVQPIPMPGLWELSKTMAWLMSLDR